MTSSGKDSRESNIAALNAMLQKSAGNINNLDDDDIFELQRLCSHEISCKLHEKYTQIYPGVNPLVAILRDEVHRLRTTQMGAADNLGMSYIHFNKVVTGRNNIGLEMAKQMYHVLGIDGNFILENL